MSENIYDFSAIPGYHWDDLYMISYEITNTIFSYDKYISGTEQLLVSIQQDLRRQIEADKDLNSQELSDEHKASWYFHQYDGQRIVNEELARRHRNGTFLSMYSFFEGKLRQLCGKVEEKTSPKIPFRRNVPKGVRYIDHYFSYLTFSRQPISGRLQIIYDRLESYQGMRNKIAHQNGVLNASDLPNNVAGLTIDRADTLNIELIFLEEFVNDLKLFFEELCKMLDQRFNVM